MRRIVLLALLVLPLGVYFVEPEPFDTLGRQLRAATRSTVRDLFYQHSLQISGNTRLSTQEVQQVMPLERSSLWWRLNSAMVAAQVSQNPLVKKVHVAPCNWWSISCFRIELVERQPVLAVRRGAQRWLVAEDGSFFDAPARPESARFLALEGPFVEKTEPSQLPAIARRVLRALQIVSEQSDFRVASLQLVDSGELQVSFEGRDFEALFSLAEGPDTDNWERRFTKEVQRLTLLVQQLGPQLSAFSHFDLGFDRLAVGRLKPSAAKPDGALK
jgi:hypothetical protein